MSSSFKCFWLGQPKIVLSFQSEELEILRDSLESSGIPLNSLEFCEILKFTFYSAGDCMLISILLANHSQRQGVLGSMLPSVFLMPLEYIALSKFSKFAQNITGFPLILRSFWHQRIYDTTLGSWDITTWRFLWRAARTKRRNWVF